MGASQQPAPVAVVIPTYQHAHFLGHAIESVLAQTILPSEILVVDDGSSDRPDRVAGRYAAVRIVSQANAGLAAARNLGIAETSAPFLLFLDADDRLLPEAIARGLESLASDGSAAFTYGAYSIVDLVSAKKIRPEFRAVPTQAFAAFLRGNPIGMHAAALYRRPAIEEANGFRGHLRACEDYDLYLRLARDHPVRCHPTLCAEYRQHGANMSADPAFMLRAALQVLRDYRSDARDRGLLSDYEAGMLAWKRHYVDVWAGQLRSAPMRSLMPGACLLPLAPGTILRKIGAALRRRIG